MMSKDAKKSYVEEMKKNLLRRVSKKSKKKLIDKKFKGAKNDNNVW